MRTILLTAVGTLGLGSVTARSDQPAANPIPSCPTITFDEPPLAPRVFGLIEPNVPSTYDLVR